MVETIENGDNGITCNGGAKKLHGGNDQRSHLDSGVERQEPPLNLGVKR